MKKIAKNDFVVVSRVVNKMSDAALTGLYECIKECEENGLEIVGEEPDDEDDFEIWGDELNEAIEDEWMQLGYGDWYGFSYSQWLNYNWMLTN